MIARPRVAFLGTPDVAIPTLEGLIGIADVPVVITQPDRPVGRSKRPRPPVVKVRAQDLSLEVAQPQRSSETAGILQAHAPLDAAVLVAFGQLIRGDALAVPRRGFLNVHFSLLPRWRGAAPVQRAIMAEDERVGVTVMVVDEGLDTGPALAMRSTRLGFDEDAGQVLERLSRQGAELLCDVLPGHLGGRLVPVPQAAGATLAPKLTSDDRRIDWTLSARQCVARIRALSPHPGAVTLLDSSPFKVLRAELAIGHAPPGVVDEAGNVGTGEGLVRLVLVQPSGKKPMAAGDWLRGLRSPVAFPPAAS